MTSKTSIGSLKLWIVDYKAIYHFEAPWSSLEVLGKNKKVWHLHLKKRKWLFASFKPIWSWNLPQLNWKILDPLPTYRVQQYWQRVPQVARISIFFCTIAPYSTSIFHRKKLPKKKWDEHGTCTKVESRWGLVQISMMWSWGPWTLRGVWVAQRGCDCSGPDSGVVPMCLFWWRPVYRTMLFFGAKLFLWKYLRGNMSEMLLNIRWELGHETVVQIGFEYMRSTFDLHFPSVWPWNRHTHGCSPSQVALASWKRGLRNSIADFVFPDSRLKTDMFKISAQNS